MQAEQTVVLDLDAQADEALEAARKLPHGAPCVGLCDTRRLVETLYSGQSSLLVRSKV